jgi:hypothetical protein
MGRNPLKMGRKLLRGCAEHLFLGRWTSPPAAPTVPKTLINGHLGKPKGFGNRSGPAGLPISGQPLRMGMKFLAAWIGGMLLGGMGGPLGGEAVGVETRPSPTPVPRVAAPERPPATSLISAPPCVTCRIPASETSCQGYRPPPSACPPPSFSRPQAHPLFDYAWSSSYPPAQGYAPCQDDRPGNGYPPGGSGLLSPLSGRWGCSSGQGGAPSGCPPYGPGFSANGYRPGLLTPLLMWFYFPSGWMPPEQGACFPDCPGFAGQARFPWQSGFPDRLCFPWRCFPWRPKISSSAHHRGYYGDLYMWIVVPQR